MLTNTFHGRKVDSAKFNNLQKVFLTSCLAAHFLIILLSSHRMTLTYDEPMHFKYGYNIFLLGDSDRHDITQDSKMPFSVLNVIPPALYKYVSPSSTVDMRLGRIATALFSILLGFYVFKWTKELYGIASASLALLLYTFSPNIIAHAGLITTDLFASAMIFISCYYFRLFVNHGGIRRALISSSILGAAQLAKYTCVFLFPIFLIILFIKFLAPMLHLIKQKDFKLATKMTGRFSGYIVLFILILILVINIGFLFNKSFVPLGQYQFRSDFFQKLESSLHAFRDIPVPTPYPYLDGLDWVKDIEQTNKTSGNIYLRGKIAQRGAAFKHYYPIAFLYKVPIATQIFIFSGLLLTFIRWKKRDILKNELFLLVPVLFFAIYFTFFFRTQIGIRFILIIFPFLFVLAGTCAKTWDSMNGKTKGGIALLVGYLMLSVLSYFPHYIPYFNELIGDRKKAYTVLADSNLDWGQGGWYLDTYLKKHPEAKMNPDHPESGLVVVSINYLVGVVNDQKHYQWLRENFQPVDHIARSYLVYRVSPDELRQVYPKSK